MKNISEVEGRKIVEGIVIEIKKNRDENAAKPILKRKLDKNGNLLKGCFAMKTKVYPFIQERYGATKEESYKAIEDLANKSGAFKIGKSKFGGIFYLPEDFRAYERKQKQSPEGFDKYFK